MTPAYVIRAQFLAGNMASIKGAAVIDETRLPRLTEEVFVEAVAQMARQQWPALRDLLQAQGEAL